MLFDNDTFNNSNNSLTDYNAFISNTVKFWVYLVFLIPSIICSLFVLYYLLSNRTLRHAHHNHAIIIFLFIGLIYEVTIYPWMLYFYHHDGQWTRSDFFCTLWTFIDWGLYYTQTILFAWAIMERHILIFHRKWISTKKKRLLAHYLPLIMLVLYCLIYYVVVIFFPPCKNNFDDYYMICVELCLFFESSALYTYDTFVHQILPNLAIVVFSLALLLRVRWQKRRIGQSLQWRKHWKMTVQLLFVSMIYLIFALPVALMNLLHLCGLSQDATANFMEYLLLLNYSLILLCPFACASALPQPINKIKKILLLRRQVRTVAPITWPVRNTIANH
jgi:hypothetical protein